jgi:hypothetical protein
MATRFQIKRTTVGGIVPTTGDIQPGELAINLADKKLFTANSTAVFELGSNLTNLSVTSNLTATAIIANGSIGTTGQVLHSNGTGIYWDTDDQGVTSVASGNGLTGGPITSTGTISVLANSGLSANATGVYVVPGNGLVTANSTGVHVGAGSGVVVNSTAVSILANSGIVANSTGTFVNTAFIGTLTANNSTNLNGQPASFYTNASNISTGTLATARLPATANIATAVNVGANVNLTTSTINVGNTTVNVSINSTSITITSDPIVQQTDIGTAPNEIPLNQYLGSLAYQSDTVAVSNIFSIGTTNFVANGNVGIGNSTPGSPLSVNGIIQDDKGDVRTLVLNSRTTSYTLVAADHGKLVSSNTTIIIPASVFTEGQTVSFYNNSAANITINATSSGVTCFLAGTANTSDRTLAQRGIATVICVAANNFVISGTGLT